MCTAEIVHGGVQIAADLDYRTPQKHVPALAGPGFVRQEIAFMVSKSFPQSGSACFSMVTTLEDEFAWLSSYHLNSGFVENVGAGLEICAAARLISTQQCLCTLCHTISVPTPLRAQLHAVIKTLWNTMREQAMQAYRRAIARAASAVATPFFSGNLWNLNQEVHYRLVLAMTGVELTDQEQ